MNSLPVCGCGTQLVSHEGRGMDLIGCPKCSTVLEENEQPKVVLGEKLKKS